MISFRTLPILLCSVLPGIAATQAPSRPTNAQVAERVDEYMHRLENLGFVGGVLVLRNGTPIVQRSYGMADRAAGIRADTSTVYNLGSITKQFTAAAILRLEEMGKLRTTDSIARFFADAPVDKRNITLHQLLTHTAGFDSDFSPTDYEPTTRAEYVRRMFAAPLRTRPGTAFSYANSGYSLLAGIVEVVTGKEYEAALRELVLLPAGMTETGYSLSWDRRRIAHGYQDGRDWGTIVERLAPQGSPYWSLRGNGGLHTTLGDIARWDAALGNTRMLTDSSRRKFMTGYVDEGPDGQSQYAYGWAVIRTPRGTRLVTHNGGNGVFVAELLRYVDEGVTIFLTSTVSELTASSAVRTVSRIVFGESYELPPMRANVAAAALDAFVGSYALPDGSRLTIRVQDDHLLAEATGQQAYHLLVAGDTTSPARAAALNAKSVAIVEALVKGDVRPFRAALGPGAPDSAEVATEEGRMMNNRVQRFGTFRSIDVLGTVRGPEGGMQTTIRLNFDRGSATNIYVWDGDHIMDVGARPFQPVELIPTAADELRSFDPRTNTGVRLRRSAMGVISATTASGTAITIKPI